jgi:PAS domain S-box-containing protein
MTETLKKNIDYQDVFNSIRIPVIIIDSEQNIVKVNAEFCSVSGLAPDQVENVEKWTRFVHEDDLPLMIKYNKERFQNPDFFPFSYEFHFIKPDGKSIVSQIVVGLVKDSGLIVAAFFDIRSRVGLEKQLLTENQALEEKVRERTWKLLDSNLALADSRERLSEAMKIARMGIFEWTAKESRFKISEELMAILYTDGLSDPVTNDQVFSRIESPSKSALNVCIRRSLIKENVAEKTVFWRSDSGRRVFHIFIRALSDGNQNLVRLIGMVRDITDQYNMEEQKKEQESLLIHQSKMATMGEMIGAIAHQWKQPLSGISIIAQDLEEAWDYGELNKEYLKESVRKILNQIDFMSETISDFRNFLHPGREMRFFDLHAAIRDVLNLLGPQFRSNGILLDDTHLRKEEEIFCYGNSNEFRHVLLILFMNSRDAIQSMSLKMPRESRYEGRINIEIILKDDIIDLCIFDNGGGIPEDFLQYLFVPYKTTKGSKGTGIGLYLSKMILSRMDGDISITNTQTGTCAKVLLKKYNNVSVDGFVH